MTARGAFYRRTQIGHAVLAALLGAIVLSAVILVLAGAPWLILLSTAVALAAFLLFGSLTVEVTADVVAVRFGPGPIGRRWRFADIADARVVRNPWFTGWGVRFLPGVTVYNVSGFDAVEIILHDGRRYRIGTADPEGLLAAIEARLRGSGVLRG